MNKTVDGYVTNENGTYIKPVRVRWVKPLELYQAQFTFTDGTKRINDLTPYLRGPVFAPIRKDLALFKAMYVDEGTIAWPGDIDIDPNTLYYGDNPIPWQSANEKSGTKSVARKLHEKRADFPSNGKAKASGPKNNVPKQKSKVVVKRKKMTAKAKK